MTEEILTVMQVLFLCLLDTTNPQKTNRIKTIVVWSSFLWESIKDVSIPFVCFNLLVGFISINFSYKPRKLDWLKSVFYKSHAIRFSKKVKRLAKRNENLSHFVSIKIPCIFGILNLKSNSSFILKTVKIYCLDSSSVFTRYILILSDYQYMLYSASLSYK